ncbi:MAG: ankyrin repeat domain-containing protein [Treponema sp.]|nr:ankyrin repeat domain-containing protein [Treponema sp.]
MSDYDYYRGSTSYEVAVKNRLSALEATGVATTHAVRNMGTDLNNGLQENIAAIHDLQGMYVAGTNATLNMQQGIRSDIQTNTNAIQEMTLGIRSDIRQSTYAVVASQTMLAQTFRHSFNAVNNTLNLGFGMVSNKLDAMSDRICSKLDEIHDIVNNPLLTQSRELFRRALNNYSRGYYEEALEDCKGAVEKNKTDFISWNLLGQIYLFGAGKFSNVIDVDKAEEAFYNAAKYIDSDIGHSFEADMLASEIYYYLGLVRLIESNDCLVENKSDESNTKLLEAEKASRTAYQLSEKNLLAGYEQAKELHFLGKDNEALSILERLIRADKNFALKASNDKNFESLWEQIDALILRLRDELIPEITSEYAAQLEKLCIISSDTYVYISSAETESLASWHNRFENLKQQLPNLADFRDKDYFTIRDLSEKKLPDFKKVFDDAVSSAFFSLYPFPYYCSIPKSQEEVSGFWDKYNQALKLHASGADEDCLKLLEELIVGVTGNTYFAIKATCDKRLESLWEIILERIKKSVCQRIKERTEEVITDYKNKLNEEVELINHPAVRREIEAFRAKSDGIERRNCFSILQEWACRGFWIMGFESALDDAVEEARCEIQEKERKQEEERREQERKKKEEEQRKQEEERRKKEEERRKKEEAQREEERRIREAIAKKRKRNCLIFSLIALGVVFFIVRGCVLSESRQQEFFKAVKQNNIEQATALLKAGVKVNKKDEQGRTPLMYAVMHSAKGEAWNREYTELLLKAGADVNAKDNSGDTPLMWAVTLVIPGGMTSASARDAVKSHVKDSADLLIKAGANVNAKNNSGGTALMRAAAGGFVTAIDMLIKAGADVNAKTNGGETALSVARKKQNNEMIAILRRAGAK